MRTLALLLAFILPSTLIGQATLPPVVQQGLDSIGKGKCQEAINLWSETWPDPQKTQMAGSCASLQAYAGKMRGYDFLRTVDISPHLQRIYVLLLCETQPAYLMLLAYRSDTGAWRILSLNWNTDPDKVLPAALFPPQHPGP